MKNASPKVDAYVAKAPDFARPILERIRTAVHKAAPGIQETIKWSTPHFEHEGLVAGMAAFKKHVNLVLWRAKDLRDEAGLFEIVGKTSMGALRLEKPSDVPAQRLLAKYVQEAMRLNEARRAAPSKKPKKAASSARTRRQVTPPPDLLRALKRRKKALAAFEAFSPTQKKEYVEWITEAKREATREKRLQQAVAWMAEGKPRNWKYMPQWR